MITDQLVTWSSEEEEEEEEDAESFLKNPGKILGLSLGAYFPRYCSALSCMERSSQRYLYSLKQNICKRTIDPEITMAIHNKEAVNIITVCSPGGQSVWYLGTHPRTKNRRKGVIFVTDWWGPGTSNMSKRGVFSPKRVGV